MPENLTLVFWLWAILGALIGAAIGQRKGRGGAGFFFGLILGPIGWIIIAVGPDLRQKVPPPATPPAAAPSPAEPQSVAARLASLKALKKGGLVNDDEYRAKREQLLRQL
jgi:4-amino-4-deoxy-L-arabinose transferase-like glycosyltransferase